ncbi:hypothetical protein GEV29_02145 [Aeromicrobium sp. SMF47]|uniref:Uncharacterized protein n=1 Tax=Aeromicrobium yanjiei TaxID=2662028 RepID=A0A5Q2MIS2_9ACTN|nr:MULTISPECIES: hypothetical protein [Aeromicrobium]MRJ75329.1 hypothetical protein [Aeromicrobium yanjiei]MRK02612.1 hypothetical protein [Aeromicrobium sp. S22]QGG40215.1 hypothetical protein GEV26_01845 [Aeromicrobium yanjiei]
MSPSRPRADQHSLDGRLTNLGFAAFVGALGLGLLISLWALAGTECFKDCRPSHRTLASVVIYGGFVVACVVAFGGARRAAGRGTMRAVWPAAGIVLVFVVTVIGAHLAGSG